VIPDRWEQVKEAFQSAIELDSSERSAYLDSLFAGEPDLRAEVDSLLRHHADAGTLLENPPRLPSELEEAHDVWIGRNIGPYQAVALIGQGGMGAVYRAVRVDDHYLKHVAIKLVRSGLATGVYLRRFKNERQIMATLDHPNIARLLDGGATDDGMPYLVMEYIEGQPIDEYCDTKRLNTLQRLKLFCQVCAAVQYAHQNLVVHRDLKPGNILVAPDGTPKLLDFGIAKLLDPELFFQTIEGGTAVKAMTPDYASPEQVRGEPITTASDVYSLGVVLYRLLTGHPPYKVDTTSPLTIAKVVSEVEPERPSTVIDRVDEITSGDGQRLQLTPELVSNNRSDRPAVLRRKLSGDLDNIVLKALRKEPSRRYGSAEQLAEDIHRYLEGMPVAARPDTIWYRTGKFARRHQVPVAAAALVFVTLVGGIVVTRREARIAEENRARAERRFNDVRTLARHLMFDVHDSIQNLAGATPARKMIVDDALQYLDSLAKESSDDKSLQRELAAAYTKVGDVQGGSGISNLGDTAGALASYKKAQAIHEALMEANPNDQALLAEAAEGYERVGSALERTGNSDESLVNIQKSLDIRKQLLAANPNNLKLQRKLAIGYDSLGNILTERNQLDEALENTRAAAAIFESQLKNSPKDPLLRRNFSIEHKKIGGILEVTGKLQPALQEYQRALPIDLALHAESPNDAVARRDVSITYASIGDVLLKTGDAAGALKWYRQALAIDQELAAADAKDAWAKQYLVGDYNKIGDALLRSGDTVAALAAYRKALPELEALAANDPSHISVQSELAKLYSRLGALNFTLAAEYATASDRKAGLLAARGWYQKSLSVWQGMQKNGTLSGLDAREPENASAELARCQLALTADKRLN
jgi:non-specific serine/threonine protein kinase/serine/threonine-protein kinase